MTPRSLALCTLLAAAVGPAAAAGPPDRAAVADALRRAGRHFAEEAAVNGGYVYFQELDRPIRWGEGRATDTQIWVQPPATPTVGDAFIAAHAATGDPAALDAATAAGEALLYGQLKSGGWTNKIDFDPSGDSAAYRNGRGRGRNFSSLDDGQTPAALRFLIRLDAAHAGRHAGVREGAEVALNGLLGAQFAGGGFPQVFDGPTTGGEARPATLPPGVGHDRPGKKAYWELPTLNDGLAGQVVETLLLARDASADRDPGLAARCDAAARRFGGFLILAQLPEPQPGWAQQYDDRMRPAWARAFEPPAVATGESQDVIAALLALHAGTGDDRFLTPIPAALDYLDRSALPDGRLPRFLELHTNRPLYMERTAGRYRVTYDDSDLPGHYGWKIDSRVDALRARYARAAAGLPAEEPATDAAAAARRALDTPDADGR